MIIGYVKKIAWRLWFPSHEINDNDTIQIINCKTISHKTLDKCSQNVGLPSTTLEQY